MVTASVLLLNLVLISATSSLSQASVVSPTDEERAINATRQLIQSLEDEMPQRILNVSLTIDYLDYIPEIGNRITGNGYVV